MSNITFIEKTHKYLSEEGELVSVSEFTERFKEKVDWGEIARKVAIKQTKAGNPSTKEDILLKWKKKGDASAEIGTLFHSIQEEDLIRNPSPSFYGRICKKELGNHIGGRKTSTPINKLENNTVYPELMIYDTDHMICGQSDKVIVVDNKINIWDYKTDVKIEMKGFSSQWVSARHLLPPLSHLEDCSGVIYSLKMSLYMYMLWRANKGRFLPGDIMIEHVTLKRDPLNDNLPVIVDTKPVILKIEQIKLPYRKKEVEAMLKTIKK